MLHLALKAFYPRQPPFPLLHVDTTWKFRRCTRSATRRPRELGLELLVHINEEGSSAASTRSRTGQRSTRTCDEDPGAQAGARQVRLRRGVRRRPPRRREVAAPRSACSRSAGAAPLGPEEPAPRALEPLQHAASTRAKSSACSRSPTGPSSTSGNTSTSRTFPIVPLYFAKERPVVERDGALIMVDDDRMPLQPGEKPEMRSVRFRTLGCYPLTGAIESDADTLPAIIAGDAAGRDLRAPGPPDRPRRAARWRRRSGRAISDDPALAPASPSDIEAYSRAGHKELLRFITCGSVDDGKSTLIGRLLYESQAAVRRPACRAGGAIPRGRHPGRRTRFRAAASTAWRPSASRASPSTSHTDTSPPRSANSSSPTRPATSSTPAIWRPAPRPRTLAVILIDARKGVLTQTRRHATSPRCWASATSSLAVNKMDLVDYSQEVFTPSKRTTGIRRRDRLPTVTCIPSLRCNGDNILDAGRHALVLTGPTLLGSSRNVEIDEGRRPAAACGFRCNG